MQDLYGRSQGLPPSMRWPPSPPLWNANVFFNPTKVLNEKIRQRDWDSARIRVLSHPSDSNFRSKQMNNATPLHLACLYRAPADLVQMILEANPEALFSQDSEGWTPLHVILLYGSDEETALLLIQRGGFRAASIHSRIVGAPLHLACRHGCSTAIIRALLRVYPAMATTANEYNTKPAKILWYHFSRKNEHLLNELSENKQSGELSDKEGKSIRDLIDQLTLLLRAAKGRQYIDANNSNPQQNFSVIHDVLGATDDTLGELTQFLSLVIFLYPEQVHAVDDVGNLPLHVAASSRPSRSSDNQSLPFESNRAADVAANFNTDPMDVLLQHYPIAASIPNRQGLLPLHIALAKGRRTWRSGIASMVLAAPHVLIRRDTETKLLPFQLAAVAMEAGSSNNNDDPRDRKSVV